MTKDDIIRMAREVCDKDKVDPYHNGFWVITQEELERFANRIAAHERDECAKVADEWTHAYPHPSKVIAETIRKRG